jgi:hypothetical protein
MDPKLLDWLKEDMSAIRNEMSIMKNDIAKLLALKYQIIGGALVVSVLLTVAFNTMLAFIERH